MDKENLIYDVFNLFDSCLGGWSCKDPMANVYKKEFSNAIKDE